MSVTQARSISRVSFSPTTGQWNHMVGTVAGSLFTLYLNGAPVGTATITLPRQGPTTPLHIGKRSDGFFFNGF